MSSSSLHFDVLEFCDEFSHSQRVFPRIIDYLAWSENPSFKRDECLSLMLERATFIAGDPTSKIPIFNFKPHEHKIFQKRFSTLSSNNEFYRIVTKNDPTVEEIEAASYLDPCFSNLWAFALYLSAHSKIAKVYRGFLPFGKEVKNFYNSLKVVRDNGWKIKGSPAFVDYVRLQEMSNIKSDFTGISTVTINAWMYKKGRGVFQCPIHHHEILEDGFCKSCQCYWITDDWKKNAFFRILSETGETTDFKKYILMTWEELWEHQSELPLTFSKYSDLQTQNKLPSIKVF
jgi:hypothetical protein